MVDSSSSSTWIRNGETAKLPRPVTMKERINKQACDLDEIWCRVGDALAVSA